MRCNRRRRHPGHASRRACTTASTPLPATSRGRSSATTISPEQCVSLQPVGRARSGCLRGRRARYSRPPGPLMMSLRKLTPAEQTRRARASAEMSSTTKWMQFQPQATGWRPSGIGRPAELFGPERSSRRLPRDDFGERRRRIQAELRSRTAGVEVDRRIDVVDHVADADQIVVSHRCALSLVR